LRLRYVDNLATKEIAVKIGKTDGAVRVMLTRCVAKLQKLLGVEDPKSIAQGE
jgi:RNA polymerase sigma-70 factor, ECF subfamily